MAQQSSSNQRNSSGLFVRVLAVGYGLLAAAGGYLLIRDQRAGFWFGMYLLVNGIVVVSAVFLERRRYQPRVSSGPDNWVLTSERFIDDVSGKEMVVRYNTKTGERDYIETPTH